MDESIKYWMALKSVKGIGSVAIKRLLERFKSPSRVFAATKEALLEVKGITTKIAEDILSFKGWKKINEEIASAESLGISILCWEDKKYPENLLSLHDPPPLLYLLGELKESDTVALAMVGSRMASSYGLETTKNFSRALAGAGVTIISGLARGIDSVAHKGALQVEGRTIAVTGCGLDIIYPPENRSLFSEIKERGAILSEFPLGTPPEACNFPRRNRLISGLSMGVVVVEASLKSGSLITARYALEQGREVYAIPGNVNSMKSRGTNNLIKDGAKLVELPEEVLMDFLPQYGRQKSCSKEHPPKEINLSFNDRENNIFSQLTLDPIHIDDLVKKCMMDITEIASVLLSLELMGAVTQHPGKMFSK